MLHVRHNPSTADRQAKDPQPSRAAAIAGAIARRQWQAARLLSRKFELLPLQARKACLLFFVVVMGSASSWQLLQAAWPGAVSQVQPFFLSERHHHPAFSEQTENRVPAGYGLRTLELRDSLSQKSSTFSN